MSIFKLRQINTKLVISYLLLASTLSAQPVLAEQKKVKADENLEVIQVYGEKPLTFLLDQVKMAELDFYDSLNPLIENPEYQVTCRRERRQEIGSTSLRIKQTYCLPNYFRNRMAQETQEAMLSGRPNPTSAQIDALVVRKKEQAYAEITKIIEQHPELLEKLLKLEKAKVAYEEKLAETEK
ncbi:hypothetical protein [Thalassotalea mangrovi]|uniref:Uncharacterized protein n=1 Tax=Thalassotalea mangrovi TaxID=2572245 RepID=A0A4U1B3I6_9GAMM|nr:hypothetical protein [Thalassotalea mangrovi]TKB44331.1 hypothetical protein E8M12_11810 [Thalassotalea mangrovi]